MRSPTRRPKGHRRVTSTRREPRALGGAVLAAIIIVGLLIGIALAGGVFVNELLDRVDQKDMAGDPNLRLESIIDPDDLTDQADTSGMILDAQKALDTAQKTAIRKDKDVYHILLIGSDKKIGEKSGHADAIMVVTINQRTKRIHLTSLLRSLVVMIPGKGWSMLNHAYNWGGADLLLKTVEDNFRIQIDDFMVIDFAGFEQAINQVGGVTISLTESEVLYLRQNYPHFSVRTGTNQMKGELALAYSRIRQIDSDLVRTSRQRRVVEALITKVKELSIGQINDLALSLFPLIKTNLSKAQMLTLMIDGYKARAYPTSQLIIPIEKSYRTVVFNHLQMVQADLPTNVAALHKFIFEAEAGKSTQ